MKATQKQKNKMKEWYAKNADHKKSYEKARQPANTSRHEARYKIVKTKGKSAVKGKSVNHKDGNPHNNSMSNLEVVKPHHGNNKIDKKGTTRSSKSLALARKAKK